MTTTLKEVADLYIRVGGDSKDFKKLMTTVCYEMSAPDLDDAEPALEPEHAPADPIVTHDAPPPPEESIEEATEDQESAA
jgi:hypothetical protein